MFSRLASLPSRLWNVGVLPMFFSQVFVQGLTLVTQFAVARLLPVEDFGVVRVVEAFLAIGLVPAGLGMASVVVKVIAEAKADDERGRLLFHTLLLTAISSAAISLALQLLIPSFGFSAQVNGYLSVMVWLFLITNLSRTTINYFQGLKQIQRVAGANVVLSLIAFAIVLVATLYAQLGGWAFGRIVGQVLFLLMMLWIVRERIVFGLDSKLLRSLARLGVLVAFAFMIDALASSADVLYLEQLLNDSRQIGYYGAAGIVIVGCLLIPSSVSAVAFPYFAERSDQPSALFSLARRNLLRLLLVMIPVTIGIYLFAPLLTLVIGESYTTSIELLRVMCWGLPFSAALVLLGTWLLAIGRPDGSAVTNLVGIAANFGLIRLLVPPMGIYGAALAFVATLIIRLLVCIFVLLWIYRHRLFERDKLKLDHPDDAAEIAR